MRVISEKTYNELFEQAQKELARNEARADAFGQGMLSVLMMLYESNWHTGTPTEKGLYVVLTKVSMNGVSSSEGTYILDYWDGYSFQYLKRKALVFSLIEPDIYSWVKWQKIEENEDGRTD